MPVFPLAAAALCGAFAASAFVAFLWALRATFRHGRPGGSWMGPGLVRTAVLPLVAAIGLALVCIAAVPANESALAAEVQGWTNLLLSLGTAFGTAAAVLARTVLVFEDGVRTGAGRMLVRWDDVSDYADKGDGRYVFFSYPRGGERRRTDLAVPRRHRHRFDAVVSACVEARLAYGIRRGAHPRPSDRPAPF